MRPLTDHDRAVLARLHLLGLTIPWRFTDELKAGGATMLKLVRRGLVERQLAVNFGIYEYAITEAGIAEMATVRETQAQPDSNLTVTPPKPRLDAGTD